MDFFQSRLNVDFSYSLNNDRRSDSVLLGLHSYSIVCYHWMNCRLAAEHGMIRQFAAEYEAVGMRITTSKSKAMIFKKVDCPL